MDKSTVSSRELNQALSRIKKSSLKTPIIITDRGRPSHVMMSYAEYQRLTGKKTSIVERLSLATSEEVDFEPVTARLGLKPAELD
ncbi:type II toxin-antitoxin system Phd/YefM family antitoxin [Marinimicrobium sp. ARAG 43.8]|uniref:type II toxin-antitoxin system Phd/YefM family antitoxin n=1 Tax=Marinimicrobium sp. ARAG 43.8 TaxID=3418719 RepID=UPI003CEBC94C